MRLTFARSALVTGIAVTVLSTTSCAPDPGVDSPPAPQARPSTSEDVPDFSGPWAAEFAENYAIATTDFERDVLADGVVSEQEYAEMTERFDRCLQDAGVEFGGFDNGSFEFSFPESIGADRANAITDECGKSTGEWTVGSMYSMISHNPENIDDSVLMTECLIEAGVVSPGYTAADWDEEMEHPTALTEPGGPPEVWACNDDPLDLFDD